MTTAAAMTTGASMAAMTTSAAMTTPASMTTGTATTMAAMTPGTTMAAMTTGSAMTTPAAAAPTSGKVMEINIADFKFAPDTLTIPAGTKVIWTNKDSTAHTVTSDNSGGP